MNMAKIFKISGYLVDPDDLYRLSEIEAGISYVLDGMVHQHIHVEESDIGKWDDESPLNYDDCDLAECEKYFKRKVPVENDRNVMAGQVYRHFKGHTVKVLHISQDTEAPGQFYVVYECEDGSVWSRPYGMFASEVDHDKYPDVKQKYRFELVEDAAEKEEFGRWIPCSERLPEKPVAGEDCYLIQAQYVEQPFVAYWDGRNWTDECYEIAKHVIAWMPLPKPYREVR